MSTTISQTEVATVMPKSVSKLKTMEDKPKFNRSSSIDTIKRINSFICLPQSYLLPLLPAILTTWLKTGQYGLQSSTEKTIFMFRSLFFGSPLFKFLLKGTKSGSLAGPPTKLNLQTVLSQIISNLQEKLLAASRSVFVISLAFKLAVILITVQFCLCVFYLSQSVIPIGLSFLVITTGYTAVLGHRMNRSYLIKRDVKRKVR